jgi:hypothetical protein
MASEKPGERTIIPGWEAILHTCKTHTACQTLGASKMWSAHPGQQGGEW